MSRRIDLNQVRTVSGSRYPAPYDAACAGRFRRCVGDAAGLTQFGVNITRLPPGCWSSQRHWHTAEDEFVSVLEGEVVLVTDDGEEVLRAGDCVGFAAGVPNGHHLQNRSDRDVLVLEVGSRRTSDDEVFYSDIDLKVLKGRAGYTKQSGAPYAESKPRDPATGK